MTKIFISYRRDDSKYVTDNIYTQLIQHFDEKNIFLDVDDIPPGVDFRIFLRDEIAKTDVVLVIIGSDWAKIMQQRSNQANDFVRIEVENALQQGKFVIPVLVKNAEIPDFSKLPQSIQELQWLNVSHIRRHPDFNRDCARLADGIKETSKPESKLHPSSSLPIGRIAGIISFIFVAILIGIFTLPSLFNNDGEGTQVVAQDTVTQTEEIASLVIDTATDTPTDEPTATDTPTDEPTTTDTPTNEPTATDTPTDEPKATDTSTDEPTATLDPLAAALDRAWNFNGTQNRDWQPFVHDFDGTEMVLVPVGCFMMGSEDGDSDEQPVHQQCIEEPFWIDRYEVTNAQYGSIGCVGTSSEPNQPHNCINWFDALAYCQTHDGTLPAEAQWEYAARGIENWVYPWGDEFVAHNAIYEDTPQLGDTRTALVGSRQNGASWVAALDMSGNLWEWTSTIYDTEEFPYSYIANDGREDLNRTDVLRVWRGGSFNRMTFNLRAASRLRGAPNNWYGYGGFRCSRPVE